MSRVLFFLSRLPIEFACILALLCFFCVRLVMNLKHKYPPGPKFSLPLIGHLPFLLDKPYVKLTKMKEKYGDIIGLNLMNNYTVFINEYSLVKDVLNHESALARAHDLLRSLPLGFGAANGHEWREQRKFCLNIMCGLVKGPWEVLTRESACYLVEQISSFGEQPTDITELLDAVISNNTMSFLLTRRLDPVTERKEIKCIMELKNVLEYYGPTVLGSLIPGFRKFCEFFHLLGYDKARDKVSSFYDLIKNKIEIHRMKSDVEGGSHFLTRYDEKLKEMQSLGNSHFFSEANLLGNIAVIYLGGSDTVTASLTWLFRLMAKYPTVQRKVQDELDKVLGPNGAISYKERQSVPYTFAVLQEAQRVSSIVPLASIRKAVSDFKVRDYTIPKGSIIVANLWAAHRDPQYWKNPDEFLPERFLEKDENEQKKAFKLLAFSIGRRNCPGEIVAWMVILSFFTMVMKKFTISVQPGTEVRFDVSGGLVMHLKPQPLCFKTRV